MGRVFSSRRGRMFGVVLLAIVGCLAAIVVSSAGATGSTMKPVRITGVTWSGSQSSPTVTVTGTGLGTLPRSIAVDELSNCPGTNAGSEVDFASKIVIYDDTNTWTAGESKSLTPGTIGSCIGLNVTTWKSTEIVFTFGNIFPQVVTNNGDNFALGVNISLPGAKGWVWGGVISGLS